MGMPASGLASRRGGQNIKPLSFDAIKPADKDNGAPTPRTSRSHLLAGLRTAPKTAVASTFSHAQQPSVNHAFNRNANAGYGASHDLYNAPKTALPRYGNQNHGLVHMSRQYTPDQVLAPPEIQIEDPQEQMDPNTYAQWMATNMYLAEQQRQLQQQLLNIQAAAQQFQHLGINNQFQQPQQFAMYGQNQVNGAPGMATPMAGQPNVYAYVDPVTGQQTFFMDQKVAAQLSAQYADHAHLAQLAMQQNAAATPRVQVSPPPEHHSGVFRSNSPPKRYESPSEPTPLPPPSANAFRRGHKKASSLANANGLTVSIQDPKSAGAGPKSAAFPMTPMTGGYGPGQARAGEHPIRQPRGPPSFDELAAKPTAKYEGSKNFAARTRRSAVHNLVRAGMERRKGPASSSGSMSPLSESAEESETPITDNDSDSGRSGSGSLSGDMECSLPSSRASTSGSWGAIGSDRPGSRQKTRDSVGSATSACESDGSFASVFKNGSQAKKAVDAEGPRKPSMVVFTSAEKRKSGPMVAA
jgi:hypothetical protein